MDKWFRRYFRHLSWFVLLAALATAPTGGAKAKPLDIDSLKAMLEGLGYLPKEGSYTSGAKYLNIKHSTSRLNLVFNFSLTNPDNLFVYLDLPKAGKDVKLPGKAMFGLLKASNTTRLMRYSWVSARRSFRLSGALPNHSIKPVDIRRMITESVDTLTQTIRFWQPSDWPKLTAAKKKADTAAKKKTDTAAEKKPDAPQEPDAPQDKKQ